MANLMKGKSLRELTLGFKVTRAVSTHIAATTPYFTITGGRVLMTGLFGRVETASGPNACSWLGDPTTGTDQPVCANLDIDPAIVGDTLTITGVGNAAMTYNASATGVPMMASPVILQTGSLSFIAAAAEGSSSWELFYIPLDDGAYVTAA